MSGNETNKGGGYDKCPTFNPDEDDYARWRKKAEVWSELTSLPEKKQGLAGLLALQGKAGIQGHNIPKELLKANNGLQILLEKLDEVYMPGMFDRQLGSFTDYYNCRRKPDQKISEFIPEYHAHKLNFDNTGGQIDNGTAGLMLLAACQLSREQKQIIRGHLEKKTNYDNVRDVLKTILGADMLNNTDNSFGESSSSTLYGDREKQQDVASNSNAESSLWNKSGSQFRPSYPYRGRPRFSRSRQRGRPYPRIDNFRAQMDNSKQFSEYLKNNQNRLNRFGRAMECSFCNSRFHLRAECTDMAKMLNETNKKDSDEPKFNYLMVFINEQRDNKLDALLNECMGLAVLDSGCPNTVCGETWMENYIARLGPQELIKVETTTSSQAFTFGDGKSVQAIKKVRIPVYWGGVWGTITTDVVNANIPLLLSAKVMVQAEMLLDFKNATVRVKVDVGKTVTIKLKKLNSGHYAIPISL